MVDADGEELRRLVEQLFQAHPWHGISPGTDAPEVVTAFIEMVPTDAVKYELDKRTGHLRLDRPQRYSSFCPTLYGFVPQTYCGQSVAARCTERTGEQGIEGDGDPMDICVLSERPIAHASLVVRARPIGGLRMIDGQQADDKLLAVLEGDLAYGQARDLAELPAGIVDRLRHYFLTYKQLPGEAPRKVGIPEVYDRAEAHEMIRRSQADYRASYGDPGSRLPRLRELLDAASGSAR